MKNWILILINIFCLVFGFSCGVLNGVQTMSHICDKKPEARTTYAGGWTDAIIHEHGLKFPELINHAELLIDACGIMIEQMKEERAYVNSIVNQPKEPK